jgi:hypothetical protein
MMAVPSNEEVGESVAMHRRNQGMTQWDLVNAMRSFGFSNWHQATVYKIEAGQRVLQYREALALRAVIGFSDYTDNSGVLAAAAHAQNRLQQIRDLLLKGEAGL